MNKLLEYLRDAGISQRKMAAAIHVDPSVMSRYLSGEARPGLDKAVAIERATDGAVPASCWAAGAKEATP